MSKRVCLTAIVYDKDPEHAKLSKMLDSAKKVGFTDFVIAVDDKCVSGTEAFIREKVGGDVFSFKWKDEFDYARNLTLARVPKECEWWGWADADDEIVSQSGMTIPAYLDIIDPDVAAVFFPYDYARDEFGNQTTNHIKGRLYKTALPWEWRDWVHEDCYPAGEKQFGLGPDDLKIIRVRDEFVWVHDLTGRDQTYSDRNLRILKKMIAANPETPRYWYYLGNQLFADHSFLLAAEAYERYLSLSNWPQEKWTALIYQAIAYRSLSMWDKALDSDTRAMHLIPEWPDSYFGMGETYCRTGDWQKAIHFGRLGIERVMAETLPDDTIFFNENAYGFSPYLWLGDAYFNIGDSESALLSYETAAKTRPERELLDKIEHLKWAMARQRIINNGIDLAAGLLRRNEPYKALEILENLPAGSQDNRAVQNAKAHVEKSLEHLTDITAYQNFYFNQEEVNDPFVDDATVERFLPRMAWALKRLKAAGAKKVLDVGVGDGTQAFYFARHGIQVVTIDVDRRRVKNANFNAMKAGYQGSQTLEIPEDERDEALPGDIVIPHATPDSMVQALYCPPGEITPQVKALGPYDAVVASELIEHALDTDAMLSLFESVAPRVLLTTPDGAYDGPQEINPGHVKLWSQREFARLIVKRGRIHDFHRIGITPGSQQNIVCEYVANESPVRELADTTIIYCGNTAQDWTPDSIAKGGIGGSETAVIRVAEELAKKGQYVIVYAECEGVWNGVRYAFAEDFFRQPCNLFVSWRQVGPDMSKHAKHRFIWAHDVHFGEATEKQLEGVTVLALSEWHKSFLQQRYPTAHIEVSGNGIDPSRFTDVYAPDQIPHRLIYAQSPDRGLDVLLRAFPKIRAEFDDAELHVFYGLDMARQRNPKFIADIELLARQPGVTLHGRIDQDQLALEYMKADALVYPAVMPNGEPFTETYCISVVEAQAAGCMPITPTHGALAETNAKGIHAENIDYQVRDLLSWFRTSPAVQQRRRREARQWALRQTWTRIADGWLDLIQEEAVAA